MPIDVRHGPDAALLGQVAFLTGQSAYQRRLEEQDRMASRQAAMQEKQIGAAQDAQRQQAAMNFFQNQQGLAARMYEGQQGRQHDFQRQMLAGQLNQQHQATQLDAQRQLSEQGFEQQKGLFDYQFTTRENQRMGQLNNAQAWIDQNEGKTLNSEQATALRWQVQQEMAGVRPQAIPKPKPMTVKHTTPDGQSMELEAGGYYPQADGSSIIVQRDGKIERKDAAKKPSPMMDKVLPALVDKFTNEEGGFNAKGYQKAVEDLERMEYRKSDEGKQAVQTYAQALEAYLSLPPTVSQHDQFQRWEILRDMAEKLGEPEPRRPNPPRTPYQPRQYRVDRS